MVGRLGITPEDAKDVEQLLLIHLFRRRSRYDSAHEAGASRQQFTSFILDKALANLIEARRRDKRAIHLGSLSLDYEIPNDEGETTTFGALLDDDAPLIRRGRTSAVEASDLRLDVERLISGLSATHRQIGELLLHGYKPSEISRRIGRSRTALDREIAKMRQTLYQAGLRDYIEPVNSRHDAVEGT